MTTTASASTLVVSPEDYARRIHVSADKIRKLIVCGELPAIDVSSLGSRRPRYRIRLDAIEAFEQRRSIRPQKSVRSSSTDKS